MKKKILLGILLAFCFIASTTGIALNGGNQQKPSEVIPLDYDGYTNITTLKIGWNLASTFFIQEISVSELFVNYNNSIYTFDSAVTNHLLVSTIFGWNTVNQQYEISNTLYGGKGYWMYAYVDCTLMNKKDSDSMTMRFDLNGARDDGEFYNSVYGDGKYIYASCANEGIRAYSFDGNTFTLRGERDEGAMNLWGIWCDGTYVYVACISDGIRAYSFDGMNFSFKGSRDDGGGYFHVWGDGTYIYVASYGGIPGNLGHISAYAFDGNTFTLKGTISDGLHDYFDVWGDGTYLYTASGGDGIRVYSFDGTTFTLLDTHDAGGDYQHVWGDGIYIYAACKDDGLCAYTFDGTTFTLKAQTQESCFMCVYGDGKYIYAGGIDTVDEVRSLGIFIYTFDGVKFVLKSTRIDAGLYYDIWWDGEYFYTACFNDGIKAYHYGNVITAWIGMTNIAFNAKSG